MKRQFSSGGTVYRQSSSNIEWLLIKPTGKNRWQFPKGWIDAGETSREAAIREVREEGGVEGELGGKLIRLRSFLPKTARELLKKLTFTW